MMNRFRLRWLPILAGLTILIGGAECVYGQAWLIGGFDPAIPAMPGPADYVYSSNHPSGWVYRDGASYYGTRYRTTYYVGMSANDDGWMNRGWRFRHGYYRSGCGKCGKTYVICYPRRRYPCCGW